MSYDKDNPEEVYKEKKSAIWGVTIWIIGIVAFTIYLLFGGGR